MMHGSDIKQRKPLRDQLAADVDAFLAGGGTIKHSDTGKATPAPTNFKEINDLTWQRKMAAKGASAKGGRR